MRPIPRSSMYLVLLALLVACAVVAQRQRNELKIDPANFFKNPWRYRDVPRTLWFLRPKFVTTGPILDGQTTIRSLPQLVSWPRDGGAFITLPQVVTRDPERRDVGARVADQVVARLLRLGQRGPCTSQLAARRSGGCRGNR